MKPHQVKFVLLGVGLSLLTGCTLVQSMQQSDPTSSLAAPLEETATPSPATSVQQERPDTRVMPITIEGQAVEMELRLFDQQPLPFTIYVPLKDFQDEVSQSENGTVAQFFFRPRGKKDNSAYVQIFLPNQQTSPEEMRSLLLDDQGLLATNNWQLIDRTDIVSYSWAREKLIYQQRTDKQTYIGSIYIGEYEGQSFYALTHYPAEYIDGFEPRSTVMLENLQFRDANPS